MMGRTKTRSKKKQPSTPDPVTLLDSVIKALLEHYSWVEIMNSGDRVRRTGDHEGAPD